jgi:hypothetical protein
MYICPVCGYDRMLRPPAAGYICPCCGVEFEVDDDELSHDELRGMWVARGRNALAQLIRAGYIDEVYALTGGYTQSVRLGATAGSRVAGIATTAGA